MTRRLLRRVIADALADARDLIASYLIKLRAWLARHYAEAGACIAAAEAAMCTAIRKSKGV